MEFIIKNLNRGINDVMRTIGYKAAYFQNPGEFSIVRQVSRNDYPRFHLYIKPASAKASDGLVKANDYMFNLHLDQKKPSYGDRRSLGEGRLKAHAHSGEYNGPIVENEAERIKAILDV